MLLPAQHFVFNGLRQGEELAFSSEWPSSSTHGVLTSIPSKDAVCPYSKYLLSWVAVEVAEI